MTEISAPPPPRRARARLWIVAGMGLLVLAVGAAGWVATHQDSPGRGGRDGGASAPPTLTPRPGPGDGLLTGAVVAGGGGRDVRNGIPVRYAHTPDGAASAATNFMVAFFGPGMLEPATRAAIIATIADPADFGRLRDVVDNPFPGIDARRLTLLTFRPTWGAYRVDSYTPNSATVTIWAPMQAAVEGSPTVSTQWSRTHVTLAWTAGDWRYTATETAGPDGPTPDPADRVPSNQAKARLLGPAAPSYREYANAER